MKKTPSRTVTVGNPGNSTKRSAFIASKDTGSYAHQLASSVLAGFESRGQGMKPNQPSTADAGALKSISPNTRTRRGPTRG